ncbi:hypothetical protein QMO56_26760 [Roseomonas sp. E05]|uniref:hypothetical protein n=1 Tax=Roseomonas sp. E05 TaxID=3046310 RepID=UPI0024B8C8E9|nr:hypothetical protein [Roseomonas sp. E05]MDJ0391693.1 hypothetical protein [Roseomonas sp. E05]
MPGLLRCVISLTAAGQDLLRRRQAASAGAQQPIGQPPLEEAPVSLATMREGWRVVEDEVTRRKWSGSDVSISAD